jgi:hypothetical protein
MIRIRAYKASSDQETCQRFLDGHRKVLEEFNLESISTNTPRWISHDDTYVVVAEYKGELVAGARLQLVDNKYPLPVQDAVAHYDPKIHTLISEKQADGGACELCGLWNARTLPPNLGITRLVSVAAVSMVDQLNIKNIFAICAGYTLYPAMRMGLVIQKQVGNNGEFTYPNSNFRARVLCMNGLSLETSNTEFREEILSIRHNRSLRTTIHTDEQDIALSFDMDLKPKLIL